MRFAELRPAMILGLALSNPVPAMAGVLFEVEEEFVDSVANPQAVALGDLDGDGIDDAVVVDFFFAGITLFLNDGEGILEDTDFYDTGEGPVAVATGQFNFNGDEFPDIVAVNHTSGTISVFYNNGEGFFDDEEPREFLVGPNPIGVAVADFNGDTLADLAVLSPNLIYLLQGHGDGTFAAFNPATISTQGSDSYAIAAGILSPGDSRVDLAVTNRGSDQIATFFGNGDGTFVLNGRHSIRSAPTGIVITDADGDGANDLVVAASEGELTSEMSLLRNDGEGRFEPVREFTGPEEPLALTTLDVEPDGKVDLVATSSLGGEIFVFCQPSEECVDRSGFPLEAGIWRPALSGTVPGCADAPQVAIVSGKLNEDSKDDFVVLKGEDGEIDTLCIALNRSTVPTPTMVTPSATATTTPPATITPSLTATATPSATATIIPSATPTATPPATATVTLTQAPTPSSTPSATPTMTRRHGGDSGCAIAATNQRPDSFVLLLFAALGWCARRRLGRGRGMASSFATTPLRRAEALEGLTESSVPLVLNSVIGKVFPEGAKGSLTRRIVLRPAFALCVVLASAVPAAASVRFNVEEELVDSVSNPQAVALADFNGDSIEDAAVVDVSDGVVVFLNDGEGTLLEDALYDTGEVPVAVATGLFNADAFVDIVVVNSLIGTVSILYNNGEGIFDDEDPRQFLADLDAMGVAVADFNNDGDNDLAVLSPRRIALLQGNGDGTFSAFNPAIIETRSSDSFTIAAGQLDIGNSNVDLAVSNRANNEVAVFIGDGNGTFRFNGMAAAGPAPAGFVIADPNLNGVNDLVVALSEGETTTEMSLLENVGDGVLGAPQLFTGPEVPLAITALDVEPDGKIDLAITSSEGGEIFVLCQPSEICSGQRDFFEAGIWRSAIGGTVRGCADGVQVAIVSGRLNTDRRDDFVALKQNEDGDIDTLCIALNISAVPTPTVAPLGTATPTPTSTPSPTASATPTPSLTPSATPTATRRHGSSDGCGMHDRPQDERSLSLLLLGLLLVGWRGRACRRFRQG